MNHATIMLRGGIIYNSIGLRIQPGDSLIALAQRVPSQIMTCQYSSFASQRARQKRTASWVGIIGVAALIASGLSGCSTTSPVAQFADSRHTGISLSTGPMTAWDRSPRSLATQDRFTHGRRDGELSVRRGAPLLATGEWPVPSRPTERRILFHRYVQR